MTKDAGILRRGWQSGMYSLGEMAYPFIASIVASAVAGPAGVPVGVSLIGIQTGIDAYSEALEKQLSQRSAEGLPLWDDFGQTYERAKSMGMTHGSIEGVSELALLHSLLQDPVGSGGIDVQERQEGQEER